MCSHICGTTNWYPSQDTNTLGIIVLQTLALSSSSTRGPPTKKVCYRYGKLFLFWNYFLIIFISFERYIELSHKFGINKVPFQVETAFVVLTWLAASSQVLSLVYFVHSISHYLNVQGTEDEFIRINAITKIKVWCYLSELCRRTWSQSPARLGNG